MFKKFVPEKMYRYKVFSRNMGAVIIWALSPAAAWKQGEERFMVVSGVKLV